MDPPDFVLDSQASIPLQALLGRGADGEKFNQRTRARLVSRCLFPPDLGATPGGIWCLLDLIILPNVCPQNPLHRAKRTSHFFF